MGQTNCCCEKTEDDRQLLQTLVTDGIASTSDSVVVRARMDGSAPLEPPRDVSFWDQIEGVYARKEDGKFMARLQSNLLAWAPDFKSDPSELSVSGPKQISMSIGGKLYTAEVIPARGELVWDDGEVWIKK
ncbi:Fe/B12 periplasmic-binding domain-containing protein [Durusdinium trenchii]